MPSDIRVKICGLTRPEDVEAAVAAEAGYLGFNFFPRSPRCVSFETARELALRVPPGVVKVALTVDEGMEFLARLTDAVPLDMLQLHGSETPEQVAAVKDRFGLPVMKVLGIGDAGDLAQIDRFAAVADQLLVDTKPPKGADRPGGNAVAFDWSLVAGRRWAVPWMLAGGLTPDNVAQAIAQTGARQVDVASGVERAPGIKDAGLIADFVAAARR